MPYVFAEEGVRRNDSVEEAEELPVVVEEKSPEELVMEKAIIQAEAILNTAREEARLIFEENKKRGYDDGVHSGYVSGLEQAKKEYEEKLEQDREEIKAWVRNSIAAVEKEKKEILDKYLRDLLDIAVAIAEKVIRISLKTSSETIKTMLIAATSGLKRREWARIHISRYSVDMMLEGDAEFLTTLSHLSDNIKIIKIGEEEGTCFVELPDEILDLSVNTQMTNIKELLEYM